MQQTDLGYLTLAVIETYRTQRNERLLKRVERLILRPAKKRGK